MKIGIVNPIMVCLLDRLNKGFLMSLKSVKKIGILFIQPLFSIGYDLKLNQRILHFFYFNKSITIFIRGLQKAFFCNSLEINSFFADNKVSKIQCGTFLGSFLNKRLIPITAVVSKNNNGHYRINSAL